MRCLVWTDRHLNGPGLPLFGTVYTLKTVDNSDTYLHVLPCAAARFWRL